jgi:competence protein ComEA
VEKIISYLKQIPFLEKLSYMNSERIIKIGATLVVGIIVLGIALFKVGGEDAESLTEEEIPLETVEELSMVFVDVGGEVNHPMVVEIREGSRVQDAIEAAGGLTDKADISDINRAAVLEDGEKIYVPSIISEEDSGGSTYSGGSYSSGASGSTGGKVNINTADSETLQTLNGVGPATAEKIISYRKENGRFKSVEDIKNVSGIGDKTYEKLKDYIRT